MILRSDLLLHIASNPVLHRLASRLRHIETDTSDGYGHALDRAWYDLTGSMVAAGLDDTDPSTLPGALAVARYHAADLLLGMAAPQVDSTLSAPAAGRKGSQFYDHIKALRDQYQQEAQSYGVTVTASENTIQVGRLLLDYLTPWPVEGEW